MSPSNFIEVVCDALPVRIDATEASENETTVFVNSARGKINHPCCIHSSWLDQPHISTGLRQISNT